MKIGGYVVWSLVAVFEVTGAAYAQTAEDLSILQKINELYPAPSIEVAQDIILSDIQNNPNLFLECIPDKIQNIIIRPATLAFASFIGAKKISNAWFANFSVDKCKGRKYKYLLYTSPDGSLHTSLFIFGDSLTWPQLKQDAGSKNALLAAYIAIKQKYSVECKTITVMDSETQFDADNPPVYFYGITYRGVWREVWRIEGCGYRADVPISFQADGNGGANFQSSNKDVKLTEIEARPN